MNDGLQKNSRYACSWEREGALIRVALIVVQSMMSVILRDSEYHELKFEGNGTKQNKIKQFLAIQVPAS